MVVLAQALICQPRYLLIDELSLGLAPVVVSRLIPLIAAVAESSAGVLLIEQFATVALGLAPTPTSWRAAGSASPAWPANCATTPTGSGPPTCSAAAAPAPKGRLPPVPPKS